MRLVISLELAPAVTPIEVATALHRLATQISLLGQDTVAEQVAAIIRVRGKGETSVVGNVAEPTTDRPTITGRWAFTPGQTAQATPAAAKKQVP